MAAHFAIMGALVMDEFLQAIDLANRVLDRPSADPDDDMAVLARQFLRAVELGERYLGVCMRAHTAQEIELATLYRAKLGAGVKRKPR